MRAKEILFATSLAIPACTEIPTLETPTVEIPTPVSARCEQVGKNVRDEVRLPMIESGVWLLSLERIANEARDLAIKRCMAEEIK